jgi:hypothetical protein
MWPAPCVRKAWLTLGAQTIQLEDPTQGYFCSLLDLGWPATRDVVSNRPDADGVDDRTQFMGARVISANVTALTGAGARVDAVASSFAPFMVPSARPVLHYVLDRPGAAERTLTVRASGYSWPISGPAQRDVQLQWLAADPVARDPTVKTATAMAGQIGAQGRVYPLTFNRTYPAGGGAGSGTTIVSPGDVAVRPLLRIYGPVTSPVVNFTINDGTGHYTTANVTFLAGYVINAGHYVDVDTAKKTALVDGDPTQNALNQLDWYNTVWPVLPVSPGSTGMGMSGSNTSAVSQVQAIWQDGYLT